MSTLSQRMTALETAIEKLAAASTPARSRAKSTKANTFVRDVIRSDGHACPECGKTFRVAERALPENHWHAKKA